MTETRRKPILLNIVLAAVLSVAVCVLSYAWMTGEDSVSHRTADTLSATVSLPPRGSTHDPLSMYPPLPMHHPAKAEIDRIVDNLAPSSGEDYRRLSRRDRYVWDVWWMDTAMMNGGVDHWFRVMGHHAPETLEALHAIGATQAYRVIKRVCDLFPHLDTDEEIVAAQYFAFFQRHGKIDDYLFVHNEMSGGFEEVELDLYQRLLDYWQRADPMAR